MKLLRQAAPILTIAGAVTAVMAFGILMGGTVAMRSALQDLSRGGGASVIGVYPTGSDGHEQCMGDR